MQNINSPDIVKPFGETLYDEACKRLLSEKPILARIMKAFMSEYQNCDVDDIAQKYIKGTPEVSSIPDPDETETDFYDICIHSVVPQAGEAEKERCEDIPKVYSIGICLNSPPERENTVSRYCWLKEEPTGEMIEAIEMPSLTVLYLGDPNKADSASALRMLDVLFADEVELKEKKQILETEFDIAITETLEKKMSDMCNLSQGVLEKGMAKGVEKGRAEKQIENIRNLTETLGFTIEQAMAALKVPENEKQKYKDLPEQESFAEGFVTGFAGSYVKFRAEIICDLAQNKQWTLEQAMDALSIAPAERETYQNILKGKYLDQTGEMFEIDNLGQDIWDKDFSEGFVEVRVESIRSLSKKKQWTLEQTMDALGITSTERETYRNLLKKQSS